MAWTDKDDGELQECLDRLQVKQKELESQLSPIGITINIIRQIQSKETTSYTEKRESQIIKIKPKDKWGNDMTDKYRLKTKNECITKSIELLGEE